MRIIAPGRLTSLVATLVLAPLVAVAVASGATVRAGTPPPTPVPPNGSPSPFPSTLHTPGPAAAVPEIRAAAGLLADADTGQVLFSKRATTPRPIASLTKIMTALLAFETLRLDRVVRVDERAVLEPGDFGASSSLGLRAGERITVEDLLFATLLGSANDAAMALALEVDGSQDAFVERMNARARQLRMRHTSFRSANGLDDRGRATPADLLRLVREANGIESFRTITSTRFHEIPGNGGRARIIQNRNALLWLYPGTFGTKTGSTAGAGYCLIASAEREGRRLIAIVLDAPAEAFSSAAAMLRYGFEGWSERTLVTAGYQAGILTIRGGSVPVVAGEGLTALMPVGAPTPTMRAVTDAHAAFPPAPGERVGSLVVRTGGAVVGAVPLVVPAVPPAPPAAGPWWLRAAEAIAQAVVGAVAGLVG